MNRITLLSFTLFMFTVLSAPPALAEHPAVSASSRILNRFLEETPNENVTKIFKRRAPSIYKIIKRAHQRNEEITEKSFSLVPKDEFDALHVQAAMMVLIHGYDLTQGEIAHIKKEAKKMKGKDIRISGAECLDDKGHINLAAIHKSLIRQWKKHAGTTPAQ